MKNYHNIGFWICFSLVMVNAIMFFASLQAPALYHLQNQHLTMMCLCSVAALIQYLRAPP